MLLLGQGAPGPVGLQRDGALMTVRVVGPQGSAPVGAMLDSGSTVSSVDLGLLQAIGAQQVGQVEVSTVQGSSMVPIYSAAIQTAAGYPLTDGSPGVLGDSLPGAVRVLLGRDVLSQGVLVYDGVQGAWSLTSYAAAVQGRGGVPLWLALLGGIALIGGAALIASAVGRREYREGRRDEAQRLLRAAAAPGQDVRVMQAQLIAAISRARGDERRALLEAAREVASDRRGGAMAQAARGALHAFGREAAA